MAFFKKEIVEEDFSAVRHQEEDVRKIPVVFVRFGGGDRDFFCFLKERFHETLCGASGSGVQFRGVNAPEAQFFLAPVRARDPDPHPKGIGVNRADKTGFISIKIPGFAVGNLFEQGNGAPCPCFASDKISVFKGPALAL